MSVKYSKDISLGSLVKEFGIYTAIGVVLRTVLTLVFIDHETGFATGFKLGFILLYILIFLASLRFLVTCFLSKEAEKADVASIKSKPLCVFAALLGVYLLLDVVKNGIASFSSVFEVFGDSGLDVFRSLMLTETLPNFFGALFAIPSAVYMFIAAKSFRDGSGKISNHKLFALAPLCWVSCKFINRFVKQISFVEVSDLFLELIMLAFMLAFFHALSQVASGIYSDTAKWRVIALGLSSSMVCLVVNIPRLIANIVELVTEVNKLNSEYPFYTIAVVFALFALTVSVEIIKGMNKTTQQEIPQDTENKEV